jgi:hypothetical protein
MQTKRCWLPAWMILSALIIPLFLTGCNLRIAQRDEPGDGEVATGGEASNGDGKAETGDSGRGPGGQSMAASPFGSPKDTISHQYVLLRAGAVEELRNLFTEDVRDEITQEMVDELRKSMAPVSLRELVHEVTEVEIDGKPAAVIKRRDGSKLTTLIKNGDLWQADTIWFK